MDFCRIRNRDDLKNYLGTDLDRLGWLIEADSGKVFAKHRVPKKNHGWREVWEVRTEAISDFYKTFARLLDGHFRKALRGYPHPAAHGYVRGRSTLTNAKRHLASTRILKSDIRAFFRNITRSKVRAALVQSGIQQDVLNDFLDLLTWDDHTPLGLPTSPVLVNAVSLPLDQALERLVPGCRYTRYSDDLTFSGSPIPSIEMVSDVVANHGFEISKEKSYYIARGRGLYVTGLCLESADRPHVPKDLKRRIRQELYFASKFGLKSHAGRRGYGSVESAANRLHGTVQYIRGVDRELGQKLHSLSCDILSKAGIPIELSGVTANHDSAVQFLFDESTPHRTQAQVICLTVVEDAELVGDTLSQFLDDLRAEPAALSIEALDQSGLHWAEMHFDQKTEAVKVLRNLPFRSFVAYRRQQGEEYADTYEELFVRLIKDRLKRHHGQHIKVLVEENSNLKRSRLERLLSQSFDAVDRHAPKPKGAVPRPTLEIFKKNSVATAPLPDLVLGVVGDYLNTPRPTKGRGTQQGVQAEQRFQWIEGKVRAVYDLDRDVVYSRRRRLVPWKDQD